MSSFESLTVALGTRSYDILIGEQLLSDAAIFAPVIRGDHAIVVSNDVVAPLYLDRLKSALAEWQVAVHLVDDGEQHKTPETMLSIIDTALSANAARDATFIALGGGVVGDMTGFAAAAFMRGVDYLQVPTTLLAQVDSSVGGKTGVNHPAGKNLIGAFHQPRRVVIDTTTLATLPAREFAAGLAEVIKYGLITDSAFFEWLEDNMDALIARDPAALRHAIRRSCELKAEVVAADETEKGRRAILNFGHTFGHAIEACTRYQRWLHGEAVAIGMLMAAECSDLSADVIERIDQLLRRAGLPVRSDGHPVAAMLEAMGHDKKVARGRIRLILLHKLGDAYVSDQYDDARLHQVLAAQA